MIEGSAGFAGGAVTREEKIQKVYGNNWPAGNCATLKIALG